MMRSHRGVLALFALGACLITSAREKQRDTTEVSTRQAWYFGYAMAID